MQLHRGKLSMCNAVITTLCIIQHQRLNNTSRVLMTWADASQCLAVNKAIMSTSMHCAFTPYTWTLLGQMQYEWAKGSLDGCRWHCRLAGKAYHSAGKRTLSCCPDNGIAALTSQDDPGGDHLGWSSAEQAWVQAVAQARASCISPACSFTRTSSFTLLNLSAPCFWPAAGCVGLGVLLPAAAAALSCVGRLWYPVSADRPSGIHSHQRMETSASANLSNCQSRAYV